MCVSPVGSSPPTLNPFSTGLPLPGNSSPIFPNPFKPLAFISAIAPHPFRIRFLLLRRKPLPVQRLRNHTRLSTGPWFDLIFLPMFALRQFFFAANYLFCNIGHLPRVQSL